LPAVSETVVTDGRAGRAARTRKAVVDALLALIDAGNLRPTAREVADAAGVSLRSVYVHFEDVESLFLAASARHYERIQALVTPWDPDAPLDERVDALVARRTRIYKEGAQVRRAALLQAPSSPALRNALERGRRAARAELEAVFAAELGRVAEAERVRLLAALEVVAGAGTHENLTTHPGLDGADEGVAGLMRDLVHATLTAWGVGRGQRPTTTGPA
jgi:AcrR family transcriptional regulator